LGTLSDRNVAGFAWRFNGIERKFDAGFHCQRGSARRLWDCSRILAVEVDGTPVKASRFAWNCTTWSADRTHQDVESAPEHDEDRRNDEDDQRVPGEGGARPRGAICEWKRERDGIVRGQRRTRTAEGVNDSRRHGIWRPCKGRPTSSTLR
jgi:hypothetical protein